MPIIFSFFIIISTQAQNRKFISPEIFRAQAGFLAARCRLSVNSWVRQLHSHKTQNWFSRHTVNNSCIPPEISYNIIWEWNTLLRHRKHDSALFWSMGYSPSHCWHFMRFCRKKPLSVSPIKGGTYIWHTNKLPFRQPQKPLLKI